MEKLIYEVCKVVNRPYRFLAGLRNFLYDVGIFKSVEVDVPVISVGNISWGGTGKTEVVKAIARVLQSRGKNVLVVSRGYRCKGPFPREVGPGDWDCDEPAMIKSSLPGIRVFVGPRREEVIRQAKERYPNIDVVVLDDGFQYRRLRRDLDIVLVRPGEECLREAVSSLKRADLIVLTKVEDVSVAKEEARRLERYGPVVAMTYKVGLPEGIVEVDLVCGVADPGSVRESVERKGIRVRRVFAFPDHHRYNRWDVRRILAESSGIIACTPKDWVKLARFKGEFEKKGKRIFPLSVEVEFLWGRDLFWRKVGEVVKWTRYGAI